MTYMRETTMEGWTDLRLAEVKDRIAERWAEAAAERLGTMSRIAQLARTVADALPRPTLAVATRRAVKAAEVSRNADCDACDEAISAA